MVFFSLISHFDKDEKLWNETGQVVTPKLGTIFYPDPCNDEIEGGYLKIWKTHDLNFDAGYELIEPKFNRLVIFDAGQLHAVTPVTKGIRKAIAINLWDEAPSDAPNMLDMNEYDNNSHLFDVTDVSKLCQDYLFNSNSESAQMESHVSDDVIRAVNALNNMLGKNLNRKL